MIVLVADSKAKDAQHSNLLPKQQYLIASC